MDSLPYTPRFKKALAIAHRDARNAGHNYVGIEHLLIGVLSYDEGAAFNLLKAVGIDPNSLREKITVEFARQNLANPPKTDDQLKKEILEMLSQLTELMAKHE